MGGCYQCYFFNAVATVDVLIVGNNDVKLEL